MQFIKQYRQPLIWAIALLLLFCIEPSSSFTLCPLKLAGADWCPGCGIGRSIHYALHFQWVQAWQAHWLGIPATLILLYFIFKQTKAIYQKQTA
jgi:hypothetical protein